MFRTASPAFLKARTAIWRLRRCVVGLQTEHFQVTAVTRDFTLNSLNTESVKRHSIALENGQGFKEVLGHYFPWLHEVPKVGELVSEFLGKEILDTDVIRDNLDVSLVLYLKMDQFHIVV